MRFVNRVEEQSRISKIFNDPKPGFIVVYGRRRCGKSTLLKILMDQLPATAGDFSWLHHAHVAYVAQDHYDLLDRTKTMWQWLTEVSRNRTDQEIRSALGAMLFSGDEALKMTHVLSGGETARMLFAKLMLLKQNVLVFDEPTNHLDLESISALRDAIKRYDGTVIFVTHDRDLVADAATRVLALSKLGADDFQGPYEEFLRKVGEVRLDR
jgi:ATPase subunit of ABC transporter with duplicated ATPase domains